MANALYFRIMGSLEVRRDGQLVEVTAPKLRIILASLLLQPGSVVPVAALIDRIWEDEPPAGARATLQTYTARLRRILGVDGIVNTRAGGYAIDLPPGSSDVQDFEALLEKARSAALRADRQGELDALRTAVGLWRGPILSDVESPALHRQDVPRLLERCLQAAEQRFELEVATGNHRGVVEELRALTALHPLREGLRAQLMRTLHRSGRRAEALDVYRDTRAHLRAELGLDPGNELESLQQVILNGQDDRAESEWVPYPVLCQLPPSIGDFVGRAEQSGRLAALLTRADAVPIAVVSGVAGVGKSTLAVHVAHQLRSRFPDGQLYINLEGAGPTPRDPVEVLGEFLHALGHLPAALPRGLGARAAAFRARVADRRVLIVLDDAADADQITPLLPGTPGAAVLVTSRRTLPELPGAHRHRLPPFSIDEGVTLLSRIVDSRRVADERGVAEEIVDLCGRLPLAVRIVGARLQPGATVRLSALADRLRDDTRRLDELSVGRLEVRSQLELAYSGLAPPVQVAVRRMGLLPPGPFAAWALGVLCDDAGGGDRLAEQLATAGLLDPVGADACGQFRYRPHDLVALYARELAGQEDESLSRAAVKRLLGELLQLGNEAYAGATRVNEGLPPGPLPADLPPAACDAGWLAKDADGWLHAERTLLLHIIAQACRYGWYDRAAILADLVIPALAIRGGFEQLEQARAQVRDAALAAGDQTVAYRAETSRADILLSQRVDEAANAFASCVRVFRRLGLHRELVHSLTGLAFARIWQGLPGTAHAQEAIRVAEAAGDRESIVLALRTHAETLITDEPAAALPLLAKALAVVRELDNPEAERAILVRITDCATSLGDLETAERTYARASELTDPRTNTLGHAWLLMHHSRMRRVQGDHRAAVAEARHARELMAQAGDTRGVATASLHLAEAHLVAGDAGAAVAVVRETLSSMDADALPRLKARAELLIDRAAEQSR
ncbi:AfsR/SARP family transcriptional regulator [Phytohabitans houttuyneae]|uniref:SARP family transcriptional regulator n=1 Tax=Phytohabitans houttuyneae TaxID=1076126 RepID=A0A6V8KJJ8_9ACTN|nr:AfsR/SARP family transcriptional regulator [Phytohabitans houttuyneae]GFJ82146.1 SARP family transcriptional regulator [Phytohabitans houttuyneae]